MEKKENRQPKAVTENGHMESSGSVTPVQDTLSPLSIHYTPEEAITY